jgi:hypothetical protein
MTLALKIDKTLRERRRINRLLDFLKRDDLTGEQMERIGRRLRSRQTGSHRWCAVLARAERHPFYRYNRHAGFFDASAWMDQLIQIAAAQGSGGWQAGPLDVLHDSVSLTAPFRCNDRLCSPRWKALLTASVITNATGSVH